MTTLHPITVALLAAADAWTTTATVLEAVGRWRDAGRPDLTTPTPDRWAELEARVAALERAQAPTPTPKPPRFVPTEPGYYWVRSTDGKPEVWYSSGSATSTAGIDWLGPVAPYAPPTVTIRNVRAYDDKGNDISDRVEAVESGFRLKVPARTEAEARAKPMRGDRWKANAVNMHYTVLDSRRIVWSDGVQASHIGLNDTYLGNFANELEGP